MRAPKASGAIKRPKETKETKKRDVHPRPKRSTAEDHAIGTRLRFMRKKAHMSQEELGKRLGISFQQVQKYENGMNRISASRLVMSADILGVSTDVLLREARPGNGGGNGKTLDEPGLDQMLDQLDLAINSLTRLRGALAPHIIERRKESAPESGADTPRD